MYVRIICKRSVASEGKTECVSDRYDTYHCVRACIFKNRHGGWEVEMQLVNNDCITHHFERDSQDVYLMNDNGDTISKY